MFGAWGSLVLELGDGDLEKSRRVFRWPIRFALESFRRISRDRAEEAWKFDLLLYYLRAPHQSRAQRGRPPEPPAILRKRRRPNGPT